MVMKFAEIMIYYLYKMWWSWNGLKLWYITCKRCDGHEMGSNYDGLFVKDVMVMKCAENMIDYL